MKKIIYWLAEQVARVELYFLRKKAKKFIDKKIESIPPAPKLKTSLSAERSEMANPLSKTKVIELLNPKDPKRKIYGIEIRNGKKVVYASTGSQFWYSYDRKLAQAEAWRLQKVFKQMV